MNKHVTIEGDELRADDRPAFLPAPMWRSLAPGVAPHSDEELVAKIRDGVAGVQVVRVTRKDGALCDHVGVFRAGDGDVVAAVFLDSNDRPCMVAGRHINIPML